MTSRTKWRLLIASLLLFVVGSGAAAVYIDITRSVACHERGGVPANGRCWSPEALR